MSKLPWIIKYRPKSLKEIENQEDVKDQIKQWLDSWLKGKGNRRAILLYGPPGSGKTTIAEAIAHDYGLELVEMNASDKRNIESMKNIAQKAAITSSLFGTNGKLIFLDEVDGINSREDTGAIPAIAELVQISKFPIIMAANDPWDPSLRELRNLALMVEVKKLGKYAMKRILQNICKLEKIQCEDEGLSTIADLSEGDARYAINLLEATAEGFRKVTAENVKEFARKKEREYDSFETVRNTFWARFSWQARNAVTNSQTDYELLIKWFDENIPIQYEDLNDVFRAYDALSRATLFLSRAKRSSWDMLNYMFDMMGPGVAMAEEGKSKPNWKAKWKKYQFPQTIQLLSKSKSVRDTRDRILGKLAVRLHASQSKTLNDVYPVFLQYYKKYSSKIDEELELSEDEINYLSSLKGRPQESEEGKAAESKKKGYTKYSRKRA
ncbi:replication factor C large subunit [Acidianus sp. RZ1]|uniref:replication factor C large subunit n=1 Tax=Acidianus sp. RZ1 TaxID=1540082 RepID=UPI0014918CFA|nr:replication factor C large subunit [Acidianus sp. RZ1]NON61901.1 replication factor C large subunit [Acidianus sp. RZ1]